jgi:polar amino acid transport system substrate-binding protein
MKAAAWLAVALSLWACSVEAKETLILVVDSATEMPMARIERDRVTAGMTLELGTLIAGQLQRELRVEVRPRKRVLESLLAGETHMACSYMPAWLPGPLLWSKAFFRQDEVIISRRDAVRPPRIQALHGQPIGTVLGFVYPELSTLLGKGFLREDAPNAEANLRKLAVGRVEHAAVSERLLSHLQRQGTFKAAIHPPLLMASLQTHCALGPSAPLSLAELNEAIDGIQRDGSLARLYRRYAPTEDKTRSSSSP